MYNDIVTIGRFTIHGYGLMIAVGIIVAYFVADYRAKRKGLDTDRLFSLAVIAVVFGLVGAKALYWLTIIDEIRENPRIMLDFGSGFVVYGGIILAIFIAWIYCRRKNLRLLEYTDVILPSVALGQGFGRIGCFLAGCCYGIETDGWLAVTFTNSDYAPNGVPLVPTQLISSALNFLNFIALVLISRRSRKSGIVTVCYLLFYSAGRFVIEFFRGDVARGAVGVLSTSQFISICVAAAALILLFVLRKQLKDHEMNYLY